MHREKRIDVTSNCTLLLLAQLILLCYMLIETTEDEMMEAMQEPSQNIKNVVARFACAFIMHITLTDEAKQGLNMMKNAVNHHWKFRSWRRAYMVGLFQASVLIFCEAVNLVLLTTNHSILDIIMNFLAIVVITEFDDFFYFMIN